MAKNFGSAGSAKVIKEVAKASAEKSTVVTVRMIADEDLIDCPLNKEDTSYTADIEKSIDEIGFVDPIDVTTFEQPDGKFMIVGGHRRRVAGRRKGIKVFPCLIRQFDSWESVNNHLLLVNSYRDSGKDPLLLCKRYKNHEEYLKSIGTDSNKMREEVAKRLGLSIPQADRYNTMNKVILPVWDMVSREIVGMSSVLPMAKHTPEEQQVIYEIMQEAIKADVDLTRDTVKKIVAAYREGKKTWAEIADLPRDSGLPLNASINTEPSETGEPREYDRNDEARQEYDPIAAEADKADADRAAWEAQQAGQGENNDGEEEPKEKKPPLTDEEKQAKRAKDIQKDLEKLNTYLSDIYTFESAEEAEETLRNMASTFTVVIDEMYNIAREHNLDELFKASLEDMKAKVTEY
jgi:hypothetical protein